MLLFVVYHGRGPVDGDTMWIGGDDNGSGSGFEWPEDFVQRIIQFMEITSTAPLDPSERRGEGSSRDVERERRRFEEVLAGLVDGLEELHQPTAGEYKMKLRRLRQMKMKRDR